MIKEIQFQRAKRTMFAMDEMYRVVAQWACHDDYFETSYDSDGNIVHHDRLPLGIYTGPKDEYGSPRGLVAEIKGEDYDDYGAGYGNAYITTGDYRSRDIHGGSSNVDEPYADYQFGEPPDDEDNWTPTYGCLRMRNKDCVELARMIKDSSYNVILSVVDGDDD